MGARALPRRQPPHPPGPLLRRAPVRVAWSGSSAAASALRGDVAGVVASEVLAVSVEELPEAGTGWTSDPELGLSFRVAKA